MRIRSVLQVVAMMLGGIALSAQDRIEPFPSRLLGRTVPIAIHEPAAPVVEAYLARHPGARLRLVLFLPGVFDGPRDFFRHGVFPGLSDREARGEVAPALWVAVTHFRSWYVDRKDGRFPYERFLVDELLPALEARFPRFGGAPEARTSAGLSMGGFGALNLGGRTRHFARVLALSPALVEPPFANVPWFIRRSLKRALPLEDEPFRPWSPRYHLGGDTELRLTAGTEDRHGIHHGVPIFAEMARKPGRTVEVFLGSGGHDWAYFGPEILRQAAWAAAPSPRAAGS